MAGPCEKPPPWPNPPPRAAALVGVSAVALRPATAARAITEIRLNMVFLLQIRMLHPPSGSGLPTGGSVLNSCFRAADLAKRHSVIAVTHEAEMPVHPHPHQSDVGQGM